MIGKDSLPRKIKSQFMKFEPKSWFCGIVSHTNIIDVPYNYCKVYSNYEYTYVRWRGPL